MAVQLLAANVPEDSDTPKWTIELDQLDDGIDVQAVNGTYTWVLFKLKNDGTFFRYNGIEAESGFKLTKNGEIAESKTED